MHLRDFGQTGLNVFPLGFGGGQIGGPEQSEAELEHLLKGLLELGVNLFDTARGYGESEARIGRLLRKQRSQCLFSTKVGYGVPGLPDWTADCVRAGIDQALRLMQTDYLDIVHLHSCPLETLQRGEVISALQAAVKAGKVRVMAYSGENEPLAWAIQSGYFGSIQTSVNLCDPYSLLHLLPEARQRGLGVIAKRPLANAFWRFSEQPHGDYAETYWLRWRTLGLSSALPMPELAIRYAAYAPGVDTCIVGSRTFSHLQSLRQALEHGPLPEESLAHLNQAYQQHARDWRGEV